MSDPQIPLGGLAVFMLIVFLPMLINPKKAGKALRDLYGTTTNIRILSFFSFFIAFYLLNTPFVSDSPWIALITILGWLIFFEGLVYMWSPSWVEEKIKKLTKSETGTSILSLVGIVLSVLLIYVGLNLV